MTKLMPKYLSAYPKKGIMFLTLKPAYQPNSGTKFLIIRIHTHVLTLFSYMFEKIFLRRDLSILKYKKVIPEHQFGFYRCHRGVKYIVDSLESKEYCSTAFLDIQ